MCWLGSMRKNTVNKRNSIIFILIILFGLLSCDGNNIIEKTSDLKENGIKEKDELYKVYAVDDEAEYSKLLDKEPNTPLITFIELGSVNCIPCKQMIPIMKSVENKYGRQIHIIFYDVWKPGQKKYARDYKIRLIPTQVFLDIDGNEIYRHEGFFPEEEIDAFLLSQGLKPIL